jgi:hypothetical protein
MRVLSVLIAMFSLTACDAVEKAQQRHVEKEMAKIHNQVADDAVQQYEIAKRGGDKMQTCVQAGFVSAAYLQAKDEPNYNKWKATEKADCKAAGMPQD